MRSSGSTPAASRSRRTSRAACPAFAIVGLADRACQEAKERVRSGIASAELEWPVSGGSRSISRPPELRKEGSGFDLPIALSILAASGQIPRERLDEHAAVGELGLDGRLRPVGGVIALAEAARRAGLPRILCAARSRAEAALAGIEPVPRPASRRRLPPTCAASASPSPGSRATGIRRRKKPHAGSRRRAGPGAGAPRARDRRRGRPQPPPRRATRNRQDDARAAAARRSCRRSRSPRRSR